ncbi:MAG: ABC transporter permease [Defluviitaleaceae bacterium]|nr:ABC transporter permease [Defluviitaleaceae bacterium]
MIIFIVRRLLQTIPVLLGVSLVVFLMIHLIPGCPARAMAGEAADPVQIEILREQMGLNDPVLTQYFRFIRRIVTGDLGTSIVSGRPVVEEIFEARFAITVHLAILGTLAAVILGLIVGIVSATMKDSFLDILLMLVALLGLSIPNFWLAVLLIIEFSVNRGLLPIVGWGEINQMVLPTLTLGISGAAIIARMTRANLLDVLNQDYIRTARAKGAGERIVIFKHALRNALIPVITVVGLQFGALLTGAIITETIFAINGMGRLIIQSITQRDVIMVQGTVLVVSIMFVAVNAMVDIAYRLVNKRVDLN